MSSVAHHLVDEEHVVVLVGQDGVGLAHQLLGQRPDGDLTVGTDVDRHGHRGAGRWDGERRVLARLLAHEVRHAQHERCHREASQGTRTLPGVRTRRSEGVDGARDMTVDRV